MLLCCTAAATVAWIGPAAAARDQPDVGAVVSRVGERVAAYYQRAQRLICTERATVVPIRTDGGVQDFARTVDSELRVELDAADGSDLPEARIRRQIQRVNGREPRERDRHRSGCTDPAPLSPELLTFLLPGHREEYRFTRIREGRERHRPALIIDFASAERTSRPELIEDPGGHEDCFDWEGPTATAGRVWVDAETYDVLRLERRLSGPTDVRVPQTLQRKYRFGMWLTIDRDDLTLRYKEVAFTDPDETILLPESIESLTVVRSGLQSTRRTQEFSGYRRFLTATRVKDR